MVPVCRIDPFVRLITRKSEERYTLLSGLIQETSIRDISWGRKAARA